MDLWKNLPDSLKYGIIIAIIILFFLGFIGPEEINGFLNRGQQEGSDTSATDLIRVKFFLTDSENSTPVTNANVVFIFDGAPEPRYTDDSGYVSISIPRRQEVKVRITKQGYKAINRTINLSVNPNQTVEYRMEPSSDNGQSPDDNNSSRGNNEPDPLNTDMSPAESVDHYFEQVESGLYADSFATLSPIFLRNFYYSRDMTFDDAFRDFVSYWERCDIDYKDLEEVQVSDDRAVVTYQERRFCDNDDASTDHSFQKKRMTLSRDSIDEKWKIDQVTDQN